jgi:DNA excision repair protein ERCC-2
MPGRPLTDDVTDADEDGVTDGAASDAATGNSAGDASADRARSDASEDPSDWRPLFGHDEPYDEQVDGIETAVETARDGGFLALEGACGTGKTMLALTAGLHLVRDPDSDFERVFVLTSVKQQLRQFEADLRTINANLPADHEPVSAMTLVGKADICPYNRENAGGIDDGNVYERCDALRERTRGLTEDTTAGALASQARSQQVGLADSGRDGSGAATYLESAGGASPYPREMPEYDTGGADVEFCPFYAQFLDDLPEEGDPSEAVPFDVTDQGLLEPDDLVRLSVDHGTCPHSVMGAVLPRVEVVVGNYYHAFDPTTVGSFTGALLDPETFVVCDEAHMLEPRVRDLVSEGVGDATLRDAESELAQVIQPLTLDDRGTRPEEASRDARAGQRPASGTQERASQELRAEQELIRAELKEAEVTLDELEELRSFVRDLRDELDRRVTAHLNREHEGWRGDLTALDDEEIPLRDPQAPAPDEITEWAESAGYGPAVWTGADAIGAVVARVLNEADDEEKQRALPSVGRTLAAWYHCDHTRYFREIALERTWDETEPPDSWRRAYNARLAMQNCVPGDAIAEQLGGFGGGVLMSATLEPIDVFERVTGLDQLREAEDRPVVERTYGLSFPEGNRASFAVAAPKFTYDNRGPPGADTPTRRTHAEALREVARAPGNVLVGMPSYAEAEWAAGVLESVDKPVLLDESTADDVTQELKEAFFAGEPKVLVTSLRGTLTEGVDYRGDRLAAAVVCGVPMINTASPRTKAVRTAYDREFGEVLASEASESSRDASASRGGFETAITVPAVRKARQAIGRVIRGPEEVGVRVLLDERYARESWDSVREYLGPDREEFQPVSPDMLSLGLERFWSEHER